MVAITATNGTGVFMQSSMSQARLERARREADQAEATARQLRAQADVAEEDSQRSQRNVRQIAASLQQQKTTVTLGNPASAANTPSVLATTVQNAVDKLYSIPAVTTGTATSAASATSTTPIPTTTVVNTQGQTTGRVVNVSA